jgi:hypothetical protein
MFDVQGARRAGYSDSEIANHLAQERGFDAPAARQAGYTDAAIVEHLSRGPQMEAARHANSGPLGYVDSLARQAAQGATFGTMDEAAAGIRTGGGLWGNYGEALAQERARDDAFRQDNPIASGVANVVGAVASPLARVGAMAPAAVGAGIAQRVLRSGLTRGSVAGASGGALAGAGEGEGVAGRAEGAAQGALLGGAFGGALGAGGSAAAPVAGRVMDYLGLRNANLAADRQILRAVNRDMTGGAPDALARASRPAPGPGMAPPAEGQALVDALGGRNVVQLAGTAANTPGAAMEAADRLVQTRRAGRPERIAAAVDDGLGGGGGTRVADEVAALQEARRANAGPRYQAAFSRIVPEEQEVARLLSAIEDPIGQQALQRGLRVMELENVAARQRDPSIAPFNPAEYGVTRGDNGEFVVQNGYRNLRLLDAIKRGYDEIVEGFRDPTSGRLNLDQYGQAVNDVRAGYTGNMREMYPRYGGALDAWAGPSQSLDAVARGRQALTTDPDIVRGIVQRLSPSDLEFFRLGVGRAITDSASDPARAATAARRLLEGRQMQARLSAAIPDPAQRAQFMSAMQREVEMAAVERAISPRAGAQTRRLQASGEDMGRDPPGGALAALLMSRPMEAGRMMAGNIYRATQGINSSTADALASRLMDPNPQAQQATVQRLLAQREQDRLTALARSGLAQQLMRGLGAGASLATVD